MRPFYELSEPARFRRLRRLAQAGVDAAGLPGRLTSLTYWENATFRLRGPTDVLVRVHRPGYRSPAQVQGELMWLHAMADDGLPVSRPLGPPMAFNAAGVPEERLVTLLSWQPGRIHRRPGPAQLRAAGRLLARLHEWSASATLHVERPIWDTSDAFRMPQDPAVRAMLTDDEWSAWDAGRQRLQAHIDRLGTPRLMHLDLHFHNVVFGGGQAAAIDFDDGGWAVEALDLAVPWTRCHRIGDEAWGHYRRGYEAVRPMDADPVLLKELALLEPLCIGPWLEDQTHRSQVAPLGGARLSEVVQKLREAELV